MCSDDITRATRKPGERAHHPVLHPDSWQMSFTAREDATVRRDVDARRAFAFRTPSVGSAGRWVAHALRTSR